MAARGLGTPGAHHLLSGRFAGSVPSHRTGLHCGLGCPGTKGQRWFRGSKRSKAASDAVERRYALRTVKQRLHQATFRDAVISAYRGRCALSGLPEPMLLDAAHIIPDGDERLGQPIVPNGIPLSKIHHAAFDAHLSGIDPDYKVHVAERLRAQNDGPMLEGLKRLHFTSLHLRGRNRDRPDRDRLAARFELFRSAA